MSTDARGQTTTTLHTLLTPEAVRDVARRTFESAPSTLVIAPTGPMRWLKPVLEWLPDAVGASLERSLL